MTAITSEPIHPGIHPAAWNGIAIDHGELRGNNAAVGRTPPLTLSGRVRAIAVDEDRDGHSSFWSRTTLIDGVILLGVIWSIPVAVAVVATPVVLAVAFLLWLVRLAVHAF